MFYYFHYACEETKRKLVIHCRTVSGGDDGSQHEWLTLDSGCVCALSTVPCLPLARPLALSLAFAWDPVTPPTKI